jgi:hypothetical protein
MNMQKFILSVILCGILFQYAVLSQEVLPSSIHAVPVLIAVPTSNGDSFGTGLYFSRSNKLFLVTVAHCIYNVSSTNTSELINSNAVLSSLRRR